MVLGIVGKKAAGKDTFANYIRLYNPKFQIMHYADRLKEVCAQIFPVPMKCFIERELKELPFDQPILIDNYLPEMEKVLSVELSECGLVATNPRHLLQLVGTEYVRKKYPTYWTDYLKNKIITEQPNPSERFVIVSDVRFESEAETVTSFDDGIVFKIIRNSQISTEKHASEREQDGIECPTFYVNEKEFYLSEMLACMLAGGKEDTFFNFVKRSLHRNASAIPAS